MKSINLDDIVTFLMITGILPMALAAMLVLGIGAILG